MGQITYVGPFSAVPWCGVVWVVRVNLGCVHVWIVACVYQDRWWYRYTGSKGVVGISARTPPLLPNNGIKVDPR